MGLVSAHAAGARGRGQDEAGTHPAAAGEHGDGHSGPAGKGGRPESTAGDAPPKEGTKSGRSGLHRRAEQLDGEP